MDKRYTISVIALVTAMIPYTAQAEDEQEIVVTGQAQGYTASNSTTATKTDTPLIDIPQTINVVTKEQMEDQAQRSMADVLRYVPGTTVQQGEGNRDQITIRGQSTTSDFFLDGVRDDVQYFRNLYNIERVEILKGPYALIFGRGGGGGIINRAQKAPIAGKHMVSGGASVNSFGAWELSGDINQPLGEGAALRLNAFYEELDNHRDFYEGRRFAINPYLGFSLGRDWNLGLSYEYVDDDRTSDRGIPSLAGTNRPAPTLRDQFFGTPGVNVTQLQAHIVKARVEGKITDGLNSTSTLLYGDYDKRYDNVYANGPLDPVTNSTPLAAYSDPTKRENLIAQTNLIWDVSTGPLAHQLLFGIEYGQQDSRNARLTPATAVPAFDLDAISYPQVTFPTVNRDRISDVTFLSIYVQDQISIGTHFDIVAGLRYDRFDIKGIDIVDNNRAFGRKDTELSPRFGLIYKPQENISIYSSYAQSFQPRSGDQFLTLSATQENLSPEKFTNLEIGAKVDLTNGLSLTAAIFQLDRSNATTPDPANPANSINAGKTRTKGFELSAIGKLTSAWQISGGYSYIDGALRDNNSVRLAQQPKHQLSIWNRYNLNEDLGIGLGVIHQSSQYAAIRTNPATTTRLPGFTRVDAAVFYDVTDRLNLQLNIENLLDKAYYADAHNNNNITPGAPINARLTARMKF